MTIDEMLERLRTLEDLEAKLIVRQRDVKHSLDATRSEKEAMKAKVLKAMDEFNCEGALLGDVMYARVKRQPEPIYDEAKIPDEWFRTEKILERQRIRDALKENPGLRIEGVTLDNGGYKLSKRHYTKQLKQGDHNEHRQ